MRSIPIFPPNRNTDRQVTMDFRPTDQFAPIRHPEISHARFHNAQSGFLLDA